MMARRSEGLGERPLKILKFLGNYQENHGYSPSIREIGKFIGVDSTSLVDYYLNQLAEKGYIERDNRVSRSIRVLKDLEPPPGRTGGRRRLQQVAQVVSDLFSIPLVGRIGASLPIPMPETSTSYFDAFSSVEVARSLLPAREKISELFALEVDGVSMIDAMVNDGDIVIMKRTSTCQQRRDGRGLAGRQQRNHLEVFLSRKTARCACSPPTPPCSRSSSTIPSRCASRARSSWWCASSRPSKTVLSQLESIPWRQYPPGDF